MTDFTDKAIIQERPGFPPTRDMRRPQVVEDLIALLVDYNLNYTQIDEAMVSRGHEWKSGDTRNAYKKYPALREDVKAARAVAIRLAGADKVKSIKTYVEAESAVKIAVDGSETPDHDIRMKASDRLLKLQGEDTTGSSKINVNVGEGDHKILIVTSGGRPVEDAV